MIKLAILFLMILAVGCTHKPVERKTASAGLLHFQCALVKDASSGVKISVPAADFNDLTRDVPASIEIFKNGKVVEAATNAMLGDRMPPMQNPEDPMRPAWALNASLGRSGKVYMGFDPVSPSWSLIVSTMKFTTDSRGEPANCSVIDSSGMSH